MAYPTESTRLRAYIRNAMEANSCFQTPARGMATSVIDGRGRTVIPELNDSRMHPIRGGLNYNLELRWDGVSSLEDALRMLKEQAARTPAPQWGWRVLRFNGIRPKHFSGTSTRGCRAN
jgi:hypothetical protein